MACTIYIYIPGMHWAGTYIYVLLPYSTNCTIENWKNILTVCFMWPREPKLETGRRKRPAPTNYYWIVLYKIKITQLSISDFSLKKTHIFSLVCCCRWRQRHKNEHTRRLTSFIASLEAKTEAAILCKQRGDDNSRPKYSEQTGTILLGNVRTIRI